jgi:DNA-binding NtrC family response regulator
MKAWAALRIVVADDDPAIRKIIRDRLCARGHEVATATSGTEALSQCAALEPDLLVLDLKMPDLDGLAVLERLAGAPNRPEVLVITAYGSIETAVQAMRLGAADFLPKPFEAEHLEHAIARLVQTAGLRRRVERLEHELSSRHRLVTGTSPSMASVLALAGRAAASSATILLLGESGTGKEVLARYIHLQSARRTNDFVAVNCATLGSDLLESELFGHERGAFTGAVRAKEGLVEAAAGGTLFLDEIAEMTPALQAKLLRLLQEREFQRVGGTRPMQADIRVIAATHQDLAKGIAAGRFREDLYYRLKVVAIVLPPLRERREDVPQLLDYFLRRAVAEAGRRDLRVSDEAHALLVSYAWPGNVRELGNVIERAVALAEGSAIGVEDLPEEIRDVGARDAGPAATLAPVSASDAVPFHEAVRRAKREVILGALRQTGGHQTRAAQLLGLTQPYLARLIKNLGLRGERE